jgi:hypothetical protein
MMMTHSKLPDSAARRRPPGGSRRGRPNKTTAALRAAVLLAAAAVGDDGSGGGGLVGYLTSLARTEPSSFAALLGKLLPRDVAVEAAGSARDAAAGAVSEMMKALFAPPTGGLS